MAEETAASDVVYDLVSIQYHALKASQLYGKYIEDAKGRPDAVKFFKQCKTQDDKRATQVHALLAEITKEGGIAAEAAPVAKPGRGRPKK